jgi:hypothetical protein
MRPNESDDVLREIRAELMAVEPSPAFAAGVRARVERPSDASSFLRWVLAAATVVVVAGGGYWLVPGEDAPVIAVTDTVPPPVVGPGLPTMAPPAARNARRNAGVHPVVGETATVAASGPDLTVITDQPEAIRRLWAQAAAEVSRRGLLPGESTEITVAPIVVGPIVVPVIGGARRGGLAPEARRVPGENGVVNTDSGPRSE